MGDHFRSTMFDVAAEIPALVARSGGFGGSSGNRPPVYKAIGISLAVSSGFFIGISFVLKKVGLLKANVKYEEEAGEGYGYLKNAYWWSGMILMIIGEICNFVAYAFVDAILVTPLGALSVVITTILSAIFLKERLSFVGKVGCFNCIIGSVIIAMNAPAQSSVATIQDMKHYVIAPGFLSYSGVLVVGCAFIALWAGPRYGKRSMFVYLSICSLIGALSVVATQGLGAAIIAQIGGKPQFKEWFLYVLLGFVITTLLTEIVYLNKALNLFNAALVTPTYYVYFTSATIVTSAVLFQGFKGTPTSIATIIMGFLQICSGVVLLQLSKSAKDVPDAAIFKGDLDQVREVAEQEQPELEPKADAIRGTAAIIRRISAPRQRMEAEEARRYFAERRIDELESPADNEIIEWDGLRRRKTIIGDSPVTTSVRRKTQHPPLGMSRFPDFMEQDPDGKMSEKGVFLDGLRSHPSTNLYPHWRPAHASTINTTTSSPRKTDRSYEDANVGARGEQSAGEGRQLRGTIHSVWSEDSVNDPAVSSRPNSRVAPASPRDSTRRRFSFHHIFSRHSSAEQPPGGRDGSDGGRVLSFASRTSRKSGHDERRARKNATEEERLGLVKNDSSQGIEKYRPGFEQSSQPAPSVDEKVDHKHPYPRARRSSSSSLGSSSSEQPTTTQHLPRGNYVDDVTSTERGRYQTVPSRGPSRSPSVTPVVIRGVPPRAPLPPLPPLPRPLPEIPVTESQSDLGSPALAAADESGGERKHEKDRGQGQRPRSGPSKDAGGSRGKGAFI